MSAEIAHEEIGAENVTTSKLVVDIREITLDSPAKAAEIESLLDFFVKEEPNRNWRVPLILVGVFILLTLPFLDSILEYQVPQCGNPIVKFIVKCLLFLAIVFIVISLF
jgi:hypothetical protein